MRVHSAEQLRTTAGSSTYGDSGYTDYFYNDAFQAGPNESALNFVFNTVLMGGGNSTDAASTRTDEAPQVNTPNAARHLEGNNYGFADGHVKWLRVNKALNGNFYASPNPFASGGASETNSSNATFCRQILRLHQKPRTEVRGFWSFCAVEANLGCV